MQAKIDLYGDGDSLRIDRQPARQVGRQRLDDGVTFGQSQFRHLYQAWGATGASWPKRNRNEGPGVRSAQHENPTQGSLDGPALEVKPRPEVSLWKLRA
jgi:hypothetical protein